MKNTVRTLVFGGQVSLTIADTTEMAREAIRRHRLQKTSATVLCKALSAMTFMSACLKEKTGEISLTLQCDGAGGGYCMSGPTLAGLLRMLESAAHVQRLRVDYLVNRQYQKQAV